jgi:ribosome recycling factor
MAYNFSTFKTRSKEIEEWLAKEFSSLRTGKASPMILDSVMVEAYGAKTPLKHVAAISIEDAKTLKVTPWDSSQLKGIESAIGQANLGVSTSPDSSGVRVIFPDLTTERRSQLIKVMKDKLEDARVSIRKEREKTWNEIQEDERTGKISEDEKFKAKDELQKLVDDTNGKLEEMSDRKEKEIQN